MRIYVTGTAASHPGGGAPDRRARNIEVRAEVVATVSGSSVALRRDFVPWDDAMPARTVGSDQTSKD